MLSLISLAVSTAASYFTEGAILGVSVYLASKNKD